MANLAKTLLRTGFHTVGRVPPISLIARQWQGEAAILGYHRVVPDDEYRLMMGPYKELSCPVSRFEQQMMFLRAEYDLVSMDELFRHVSTTRPGFVVAVTFDDGYIDNYYCALPVLEALGIPATIFVTTRFPEGDTKMWWFDLWDEILLRDRLAYVSGDQEFVYSIKTIGAKRRCYQRLRNTASNLSEANVWDWLGNIKNGSLPSEYPELVCDWDALRMISENPLISIGAHSHNHCVLSLCTDIELDYEMKTCKHLLEKELSIQIEHFAYPYGRHKHAGEREFQAAMDNGFETGVTTIPTKIKKESIFCLGRHLPHYFTLNYHLRNKLNGWNNLIGLSI